MSPALVGNACGRFFPAGMLWEGSCGVIAFQYSRRREDDALIAIASRDLAHEVHDLIHDNDDAGFRQSATLAPIDRPVDSDEVFRFFNGMGFANTS